MCVCACVCVCVCVCVWDSQHFKCREIGACLHEEAFESLVCVCVPDVCALCVRVMCVRVSLCRNISSA